MDAGRKKDVRAKPGERVSRKTKTENSLPKIEPLPGAVCKQFIRCGRSNCKCASGLLHGPYHYRFFIKGGRQRKLYIRKRDVEAILTACLIHKEEQRAMREMLRAAKDDWRIIRALLKEYQSYGGD